MLLPLWSLNHSQSIAVFETPICDVTVERNVLYASKSPTMSVIEAYAMYTVCALV